jgi:hypothetical protein
MLVFCDFPTPIIRLPYPRASVEISENSADTTNVIHTRQTSRSYFNWCGIQVTLGEARNLLALSFFSPIQAMWRECGWCGGK